MPDVSAKPLLKAALLSFQRGPYLREALLSLLEQTLPPTEIYILDNGSTPSVLPHIEDLLGERVFFKTAEKNNGVNWNLKRALNIKDCEYLYIMHDDDKLNPAFSEEQISFLQRNPDVVAIGCDAEVIGPDGARFRSSLLNRDASVKEERFISVADMIRFYMRSYMVFPSMIYRAGKLREEFLRDDYGQTQDVVFLCELARMGPIVFRNRPLMQYRIHSQQNSAAFKESNMKKLDEYFLQTAKEFPELHRAVHAYVLRRKLRRPLKKIGEWIRRYRYK